MRIMVLMMVAAIFSILAIKSSENSLSRDRLTASPTEIATG